MSDITIENSTNLIKWGVIGGGLFIAWRLLGLLGQAYKSVDSAVDSVVDPLADKYFKWRLGDGVEHVEFNITRLHRDFFDPNWVMLSEPYEAYMSIYPVELSELLTSDKALKEEYRGVVF